MALFAYQMKAYLVVMKNRREIVQLGLASPALAAMGFSETRGGAGMKTIYKRDLPPVSLDGWQVTVLRLIFPTGFGSPKHVHSRVRLRPRGSFSHRR